MMARKRVTPPVTPRIVQTSTGHRMVRYALLSGAFLVAIWLSYGYGLAQHPGTGEASVEQLRESKQRIIELEQERDILSEQVTELERSVQLASRALANSQPPRSTPKPALSPPPKPAAPRPVAGTAKPADRALALENIRIQPGDAENAYQLAFSVGNAAGTGDRIIGTIWIAVDGLLGKQPKQLSFKTLSSDQRSYVKMGFEQQQDVAEHIVLPENFRAKSILIEAKPYGDKYTATSKKLAWPTND